MYGWGAVLFKDSGEVCVSGDAREREPRRISQGEAHVASLALSLFGEVTPKNLHSCIDNAVLMNKKKKGAAHSDALVREPSLIDKALQEQGVLASCSNIASAKSPADGISRGNRLRNVDVAKGWHMRRGARKAMQTAFSRFLHSLAIAFKRCPLVMASCFPCVA
ncbi:hypothetical protein ERJ75_000340600 [Trypanosoma vivax]|nr:hypothetical protein ERJ75_000340600 [Trypanosoma vivax]